MRRLVIIAALILTAGRSLAIEIGNGLTQVGDAIDQLPQSAPSSLSYVFTNKTTNLPAYSIVKLNGTNAGEVIEAPAGEQNIVGCAQNSSTLAADQAVEVVVSGLATCKTNFAGPNDIMTMDPSVAGQLKAAESFTFSTNTARLPRLGIRLDGNTFASPGTFLLFGRYYKPTTVFSNSYTNTLSNTERFFSLSGVTSALTTNDDAETALPLGYVGQVDCYLTSTPPATLTVRIYKNNASQGNCTMTTAQTTCTINNVDIASAAGDRWALSGQLASSTDTDDLSCVVPFTPAY